MADYSVSIDMEQATVDALTTNKYNLYGFKAVKAAGSGQPTVWFKTTDFSLGTDVSWEELYQAYTSKSQIIPNGQIKASANYDIDLDQTLNVQSSTGTGSVDTSTGVDGAISINNQTTTQFTCGISQQQADGTFTPLCAFPLFGNNMDVMGPIEKVFLMFSTTPANTGTVVFQAYSQGILIDLTGVGDRTVSFDINQGWSWEGSAPWAKVYPPNANLAPLLIVGSGSLEQKRLMAMAAPSPALSRGAAG
jgi:hypothetical protein